MRRKGYNKKFYVYILECIHKNTGRLTYYTGYSKDWEKRIILHKKGSGAQYTKDKHLKLVHLESYDTQLEAMRRETEIKKLGQQEKQCLFINGEKDNKHYKKAGNNMLCPICRKPLRSSLQRYSIQNGWRVVRNTDNIVDTLYSCTALKPCISNVSSSLLKSYTKRMKGEIK